jgi:hypothetical protein
MLYRTLHVENTMTIPPCRDSLVKRGLCNDWRGERAALLSSGDLVGDITCSIIFQIAFPQGSIEYL